MRRPFLRLLLPVLIAAAAASCAPAPAPQAPPPPPAAPEVPPVPRPVTPRPRYTLSGEPLFDVGLAWDLDSLTLAPARRVPVRFTSGASIPDADGDALVVRRKGGGFDVALRGSLTHRLADPRDTLWVGDPRAGAQRIGWGGKTWRGQMKVFLNPRGTLTLAVRLPLETYLLGVVPYEIGGLTDSLFEAGRAQAIAARSYTLFYRGRRGDEGFDLYGTVEDQVYGPTEGERPIAARCVESTRGEVELSDGFPIRANYSSTCGGISAEVWEAWPTDPLPYLVSQRDRVDGVDLCAGSPHYRWREEWSARAFLDDLATHAPAEGVGLPPGGLGRLVDVRVAARSRSGRVWRLVVSTTTGEVVIPAYALRRVLRRPGHPNAILRSTLFKVDVRRDRATRRALAVVMSGAGNGHGVGLCQTGALGMARLGRDGEAIVRHYYPGAELRRLY